MMKTDLGTKNWKRGLYNNPGKRHKGVGMSRESPDVKIENLVNSKCVKM